MANHISHSSLPYPIKNARFTVLVPYLDADGDPTDPTTPDTEVSQDGGAFADAAEEVTTITGSNGSGYVTLTGAETNNSAVAVAFKVASGPKATLMNLYPRNLPILESGTAGAGASGSITLASGTYTGLNLTGCFVRTTGGTGGGGTGGANNQARRITAYNTGTRVATVTPNWETTPDNTTTYDVLLPEGVLVPMLTALPPTTLGRTLDVSAAGNAGIDWSNVENPTTAVDLSGTTLKGVRSNTLAAGSTSTTAVLDASASASDDFYNGSWLWITTGSGAGQVRLIKDYVGSTKTCTVDAWVTTPGEHNYIILPSNTVNANVIQWLGTACAAPTVAGVPEVDITHFNGTAGTFASGRPEVNVSHWRGGAVPNNAITGVPVVDLWYLNSQTDPVDIAGGFFGGYGTVGDIYMNSLSWSGAMTAIDMTKINSILTAIRTGTAQAGSSNSITLDASASATNDFYNGATIYLTGGTGAGQYAVITDYVGATKVASIVTTWRTDPDATTTFAIYPYGMVELQTTGFARAYEPTVPGAVIANLYYVNDSGTGVEGIRVQGDDYFTDGYLDVNLTSVKGDPLAVTATGYVPVDLRYVAGVSVNTSSAQLGVNVVSAGGVTWASGSITSGVVAASAATEIAQAVLAEATADPIHANVKEVNSVVIDGVGTAADPWGPV